MEKNDVALVALATLLISALAAVAAVVTIWDLPPEVRAVVVIVCVLAAGVAGWLFQVALHHEGYTRLDIVDESFEALRADIRGHMREHEVQPLNPESLKTQLAANSAMLTQIHAVTCTPPPSPIAPPATHKSVGSEMGADWAFVLTGDDLEPVAPDDEERELTDETD